MHVKFNSLVYEKEGSDLFDPANKVPNKIFLITLARHKSNLLRTWRFFRIFVFFYDIMLYKCIRIV